MDTIDRTGLITSKYDISFCPMFDHFQSGDGRTYYDFKCCQTIKLTKKIFNFQMLVDTLNVVANESHFVNIERECFGTHSHIH